MTGPGSQATSKMLVIGAGGLRAIALGLPFAKLRTLSARLAIIGPRLVHSRIGETSVFVQSGKKISELPVVVKKVQNVFDLYKQMGIPALAMEDAGKEVSTSTKVITSHMNEEEKEVIGGFDRCVNSSSIFRLLETIPPDEGDDNIISIVWGNYLESYYQI